MSKKFEEIHPRGKIVFFIAKLLGSIFCLMLGILFLGVFAVSVSYFSKAIDITRSESLIHLFDAIGLTALAVAVLDLAITIFREVILREVDKRHPSHLRRSLTRFGTIIIIATLIEGFIMIFRFNKTDQTHLIPYSTLVFVVATLLIVGLGIFIKITIPVEKLIEKAEK